MVSYSDLKIDSEYLLKGFYLRPGWKLDIRVHVVAFCPQSVCFAMTFQDASTSKVYSFNVSNYLRIEFRDFFACLSLVSSFEAFEVKFTGCTIWL